MLIIEVDDLKRALDIMSEGFKFNSLQNPGLLKFHGCYLEEIQGQVSSFLQDEYEGEGEEEESKEETLTNISTF